MLEVTPVADEVETDEKTRRMHEILSPKLAQKPRHPLCVHAFHCPAAARMICGVRPERSRMLSRALTSSSPMAAIWERSVAPS